MQPSEDSAECGWRTLTGGSCCLRDLYESTHWIVRAERALQVGSTRNDSDANQQELEGVGPGAMEKALDLKHEVWSSILSTERVGVML